MRRLVVSLDAFCALREASGAQEPDPAAAAALAELAGADAIRLGLCEELRPVRESDARELRRPGRELELRIAPSQALLKLALEVRPDRVLLGGEGRERGAGALDPRQLASVAGPVLRALRESGIAGAVLVGPEIEAVKAAHAAGAQAVELHTGLLVDLPASERAPLLERLADACRLAAKLRMETSLGGGLGFRSLPAVLSAAPSADGVAVGRALAARAALVGLDRAIRDLRALVA
jgi:pyridoxine 5-phosphate synthase